MKFTDQCENSEHDFYPLAKLGQNQAHLTTEVSAQETQYLVSQLGTHDFDL